MNNTLGNIQGMLAALPPAEVLAIETQVVGQYRTFLRHQLGQLDASRLLRTGTFISTIINEPIPEEPEEEDYTDYEDDEEEDYMEDEEEDYMEDEEDEDVLLEVDSPEEDSTQDPYEMMAYTCQACVEEQPGQLAHMGPGGCLHESVFYTRAYINRALNLS